MVATRTEKAAPAASRTKSGTLTAEGSGESDLSESVKPYSVHLSRAMHIARATLDEHRLIICLALGYIAVGGAVLTVLGRPWPLGFVSLPFTVVWLYLSVAWLIWQWLRDPQRLWAALAWPRLIGALLILMLAVPLQITVQSLKQSIAPVLGFSWDVELSQIDRVLHAGPAWQLYARIVHFPATVGAIDFLYGVWFGGLLLFVVWGCWTRFRDLRERALVAYVLIWIVGGTLLAALFASAGPCYYHHLHSPDPAYSDLMAALAREPLLIAARAQTTLWEARQADRWLAFGGISAFPSMHVAATVLWAIVAWQRSRALAVCLWGFALITQIGSVLLGWHYAIDGYAGALIAWGCWCLAGRLGRVHDAATRT